MNTIINNLLTATVICTMAFVSGCASVDDFVDENPATSRLVVTYATAKAIEQSTALTSEKVIAFVDRVEPTIQADQSVTLEFAYILLRNKIDWQSYSPADQALIAGLLEVGAEQVRKRIDVGQVNPDEQTTILTVLGWVREGASYSASGQPAEALGLPPLATYEKPIDESLYGYLTDKRTRERYPLFGPAPQRVDPKWHEGLRHMHANPQPLPEGI